MSLPADYHMHTPLCRHATGEPTAYASRAVAVGLTEIGFSDHNPMPRYFDEWRMLASDLEDYIAKVEQARKDHPRLRILIGLEVDYLPGYEEWVRELAGKHPWDYFIGSVHYVTDTWAIDNPNEISEWKRRDPLEVWTAYFDRLTLAAESGLFDIIGHADLCKKFSFFPSQDCTPLFRKFLRAARNNKVAIEINTAGLRKECREMYPSPAILKLAAEEGVRLTFGSDAHGPEEVGLNFSDAVKAAKTAGFQQWARFRQRKAELIDL